MNEYQAALWRGAWQGVAFASVVLLIVWVHEHVTLDLPMLLRQLACYMDGRCP